MSNRFATVELEYQQVIHQPPVTKEKLYGAACSNDSTTIDHWRDIWLGNIKKNHEEYGDFAYRSAGQFFGKYKYGPCIIAGAGPSLKLNAKGLINRGDVPLVSVLHNYHYLEDLGITPEFYISLDAGDITAEEVSEGGRLTPGEYWETTKDKKLVCFIGTSPKLLEKWQGEIYWFNAPIPNKEFEAAQDKICKFNTFLSNGGNVLGAALYFAKGIMGAWNIIYVGADFSFGYPEMTMGEAAYQFHSWKSKYDAKMGQCLRVTDIYGNKVKTWPSYYNFKSFFDFVSLQVPGEYVNATEGGCLGAYPEGNLSSFKYMSLDTVLKQLNMCDNIKDTCDDPKIDIRKILY